ncbi:MAG: DEAD/DEAH box helicase [Anaerofustis sp.]
MNQTTFASLQISDNILRAVEEMGYSAMTPIQAEAIPYILEGRDVIGKSSTGTGKTAAFGIPCVEKLTDEPGNRPKVLIMAPTRELAEQISGELRKYAVYKPNIAIATVYGGQSMELQFRQLKRSNIVVGTPGRIMDHMRRKTLRLDCLETIILDEADEMLNMGFYDDIKLILGEAPEQRQTILFSATMPPAIMKLTEEFQTDPVLVEIKSTQQTAAAITQRYYMVPQNRKTDALKLILSLHKPSRALIFSNTKSMVDELVNTLEDAGFACIGLHGDMKQSMRNKVMQDFKTGKIQLLIATDVAARGIDVTDIDAVYNYDLPQESEYYVHRIGRTGRAGKDGAAYTLIANRIQLRKLQDIQYRTKANILEEYLPTAKEIREANIRLFRERLLKASAKTDNEACANIIETLLNDGLSYEQISSALLHMLLKKDKTILPSVDDIIVTRKNDQPRTNSRRGEYYDSSDRQKTVRLKFDIGKQEGINPNHIVGTVTELTGLSSKSIGKIDMFRDFTVFEMSDDDAAVTLERIQSIKIKGKRTTLSVLSSSSKSDNANKRRYQSPGNRRDARQNQHQSGKHQKHKRS